MNIPRPLLAPQHATPWLQPYREGLCMHELRLPRCSECGAWDWYPLAFTSNCHHADLLWQALTPGAEIYTFTHVERPLLAGVTRPYTVGLVVPDDAPSVRIAARLVGSVGSIEVGARARLAFSGLGDSAFPYYNIEVSP